MKLLTMDGYAQAMEQEVTPYLKARMTSGRFARVPGEELYYEHIRAKEEPAKKTLVMVHGFTENIVKLYETAYYFHQLGFEIWMLQQRGHGNSFRGTNNKSLVHIRDFMDLIEDLHYFVSNIVGNKGEAERVLFGHSMGGGVSAAYLETYPDDFDRAILSSPMLEMNSGGTPVWVASLLAHVMIAIGKEQAYLPGSGPYRPETFEECFNTDCKERFEWYSEKCKTNEAFQMCAPSMRTALQFLRLTRYVAKPENLQKVKAKILLIQAGKDAMVLPGGQVTFAEKTPDTKLVTIDAPHEIYRCKNEVLEKYWDVIEAFI